MKVKQKRLMSMFFAILMLISIIPMGTISTSAAGNIKSKLDAIIADYPSGGRWTSTFDGGSQCYGFARMVVYKIFGTNNGQYRSWNYAGVSTSGMETIGSVTSFSADNVKSLLSKAKCGDVLQFDTTKQHSMIVYSVESDGVKIYDCNWDNNCGISLRKSSFGTWSGRNSSKLTLLRSNNYSSIDGPHVCEFTGSYFESAHPHKIYKKCSCGKTQYTGSTRAYQSCSTCMKLSTSYIQPIKAYTINTGKTTVYSTVSGTAKSNKIYDTDLCTISQIYDCGWCKVTFPLDSGGTDTGYCKISLFMKGSGYIVYTSKQTNAYRRSDLKTSNGYAGAGDKIYILDTASSAVQIAYPLSSGGYKVGWVPTSAIKCSISYNANSGTGSMSSTSVQYNNSFTLAANKFTKVGHTFDGWNVYRNSDKKWYVSSIGWKTASDISKNSYTKTLYKNQYSGTLSKAWIESGKTNDTFTFYAVWSPNKLSVNYNANGGTVSSDTYKLSSNLIYKKSDNTKLTQTWTYNSAKKDGLYNASTFGLTRDGYKFKGWGTTKSGGTVFDQSDSSLVPTSINSSIKNGNCSTTLYAIWEPIPTAPTIVEPASITLNTASVSMLIGSSQYLYATVSPSNATDKTVAWSSSNTNIATVNSSGYVTAKGVGTAVITAKTANGKTANCTVTVNSPDTDKATISANTVTAKAGDTVTVNVSLKNNPGFGGMAYDVKYDNKILELLSYECNLGKDICTDSGTDTYVDKINFQYAGTSNITGDGVLVTLTFKVKDTAPSGLTNISIIPENGTFFSYNNKTEVDFTVDCVNGGVNVSEYVKGDINGDGKVNNRDAARLLQKLAGWDVYCVETAMDVNGDGKSNNRDAARILQYCAGWNVELY